MEIKTRDFGIIEISEDDIIDFPVGIPGFSDYREFVLLPLDEDSPFVIMQSVEESELAFILISPWEIVSDYEFEIGENIEKALRVETEKDLLVFVTVSIRQDIKDTTVNLAAPLIINKREKIGRQLILEGYPVRQPVFADEEQVVK
ncbi:MAG: flagellar assembly protein FliW [Halanaerobiaceae bacterium]|nr:flagellar assembly protein FliW [Halanaerobiaceae bacterium]